MVPKGVDEGDVMETRLSGNAFQILAAATGKARLPARLLSNPELNTIG